jgi:hypothetical protein
MLKEREILKVPEGGPESVLVVNLLDAQNQVRAAATDSEVVFVVGPADKPNVEGLLTEYARVIIEPVVSKKVSAWANGGQLPTRAPRRAADLMDFSFAAAQRYGGEFMRDDGTVLPRVRYWTAWNEPNLTIGLVPQWKRVGKHWVIQSAIDYARICNAVVDGVRGTLILGERIACGDTGPRGNNAPVSERPTTSPIAFLRAMKRAGATGFDAYAHHPYPSGPSETPTTRPRGASAVTFGNLDTLVAEVTKLYGHKEIWLDEYGYQTNPPDDDLGVTPAKQARFLTQSVALARKNPRVTMLLWFLVRDEHRLIGWQSGLETWDGKRKPAFAAFQRAAR